MWYGPQVLPHPPPPNVHYHKPRLLEYGCHHGKMMLLFWKGASLLTRKGLLIMIMMTIMRPDEDHVIGS